MMAVLQNPIFRNFTVPLALIVLVVGVWEYSKPRHPAPQVQKEDHGPPPPRNPNEELHRDSRMRERQSTLKILDANWASFCAGQGRTLLVNGLNGYFYFRDGAERSYPARWGEVGQTYITREYSTTEDRRIEQRVRELYSRGYLEPKMFDNVASKRVTALVQGLKPERKACGT